MAGHAFDPPGLLKESGGPDHDLGRDACPIRAFPTDQLGFDTDDFETGVEQAQSKILAARSQPEQHHISLIHHDRSLSF
jgi:hypothetical protein